MLFIFYLVLPRSLSVELLTKKAAVQHFSDNLKLSFKNVCQEKVFNEDACAL